MPPKRESNLTGRIMEYINNQPGCLCRKRWVGLAPGGRVMGTAGDPDLYGSLCGTHFEFEIKLPGERPSALQMVRLAAWSRTGALAGWFDNFDEAKRMVDSIVENPRSQAVLRNGTEG